MWGQDGDMGLISAQVEPDEEVKQAQQETEVEHSKAPGETGSDCPSTGMVLQGGDWAGDREKQVPELDMVDWTQQDGDPWEQLKKRGKEPSVPVLSRKAGLRMKFGSKREEEVAT